MDAARWGFVAHFAALAGGFATAVITLAITDSGLAAGAAAVIIGGTLAWMAFRSQTRREAAGLARMSGDEKQAHREQALRRTMFVLPVVLAALVVNVVLHPGPGSILFLVVFAAAFAWGAVRVARR